MFYVYLYTYLVFFLIFIYALSPQNTILNNNYVSTFLKYNLIFISIFVIGFVDIHFTDRIVYTREFNFINNINIFNYLKESDWEPLYIIVVKVISLLTSNPVYFYIILHVLFLFILIQGLKKIFLKNNYIIVLILLLYLNYPFYFGFTLNGLRQGLAMATIVLALGYAINENKIKLVLASITSVLFHYATIPVAVSMLVIYFFKKIKIYHLVVLYIILSLIYLADLQPYFINNVFVEKFEGYFSDEMIEEFGGSNKLSYLVFNTFWLMFFLLAHRDNMDKVYLLLIKSFLFFSNYFLIFGFIAFSNRIASYSWFIIPIILGYTLENKKSQLLKVLVIVIFLIVGIFLGVPHYIA